MLIIFQYKFEICLPDEQIKYFDYLARNYYLIEDKYNYEKNKGSSYFVSVIFGLDSRWTYHTIHNGRIIITGGGNKFPEPYFACLQETLIKFDSDEEFQFCYKEYDHLYQVNITKSSYSEINRSDLLEFI